MHGIPEKRQRLTAAAAVLAHRKGFANTTLADIAEMAEVPLGGVYYYFKSKDELAQAISDSRLSDINALLVRLAKEGRKVVRLKGGHPTVFARGGEEALALVENGIPYRILPGVTSAFGGLASAGIPVTMRGVNGAVILATGFAAVSDDRPDWAALARTGQPLVIYMGLTHMEETVADLRVGGLPPETPAALVENATLPEERVVVATLGTLAETAAREQVASPALIVVGGIVALREAMAGSA